MNKRDELEERRKNGREKKWNGRRDGGEKKEIACTEFEFLVK